MEDTPSSRMAKLFQWLVIAGAIAGLCIGVYRYLAPVARPGYEAEYPTPKYVCHVTHYFSEAWVPWNMWGTVNAPDNKTAPQGNYVGDFYTGFPTSKPISGWYVDRCLGPFSNSSEACPEVKKAKVSNPHVLQSLGCR